MPCDLEILNVLFPHLATVTIERIFCAGRSVRIQARTRASAAACPACGMRSRRVHSRYVRRLCDAAARLDGRPASRQQAKNIHDQVAAAAALLDWLTDHGLTLGACTQADLDQWLAGTSSHLVRSANFVRWAVAHRRACGLTAPATRWHGPSGPLDQDRRWADARRLLHEESYPAADRVAGLLVLLYAQKLSDITALTTRHVQHQDGRVLLRLGSRPVVLPALLDDLVAGLAAGHRPPGSSLLGIPSPWLFPGRWPGRALTEDALAQRLHALGISPRQGRSTALFTLAAEVPAAILAKTLGIHVQAAIQWQKFSAGDWTAYAAGISDRADSHGPAGTANARKPGPQQRAGTWSSRGE